MTPAKRRNFERLLNPRHIAFVGGRDAAVAIGEARRAGFAGQMWAVNPKRDHLAGLQCVPALSDLPEAPDAVFLAIPAEAVPEAIEALVQMGAGGIVCYSAGFGEAHDAGRALEEKLKAALGDMVLIGPNCYGLINYIGKSSLWPFAHGGTCPGYGAAVITQSGMFSSDITMSQRSLPLAYMVSVGNQADLAMTELVDLLCHRQEVRAIGLHIEGVSDVTAFERVALRALEAGTPIVALKTGSSQIGENLTLSHTGSLAGSHTLYQALFERTGVISVTNPSQMLETLKYLCVVGPPKGRDVLGFTCSGGGATMLADHGETIGLAFPAPGQAAKEALTSLLPPIATMSNPLDYTTPIWGHPDKTKPVFAEALRQIPAHATVLVQDYPAAGLDETEELYLNDGLAFAEAATKADVPAAICATLPENMGRHIRERYLTLGVAPMQGIHETLNAVRDAAWWQDAKKRITGCLPDPLVSARITGSTRVLNEAEAKALLAAHGLTVPKGWCVRGENLATVADEIAYPVALKMMGRGLVHKTEAGAVMLNLDSPDALGQAVHEMREAVALALPAAVTDEFLVESMAPAPLAELVVGIRRDAQFGLVMTLGSGGVLVELLGDTVSLLLPCHRDDIERGLRQLRVARLLDGFRGKPAADMSVLVDALMALADYAMSDTNTVEIEINPLFVYESSVLAVDAFCIVECVSS